MCRIVARRGVYRGVISEKLAASFYLICRVWGEGAVGRLVQAYSWGQGVGVAEQQKLFFLHFCCTMMSEPAGSDMWKCGFRNVVKRASECGMPGF